MTNQAIHAEVHRLANDSVPIELRGILEAYLRVTTPDGQNYHVQFYADKNDVFEAAEIVAALRNLAGYIEFSQAKKAA